MRLEPPIPAEALAAIRAPFQDAGAAPVDPPVLQPLGLLLDLAGEAMRARLFAVSAEGAEDACLRPDFTLPVARQHLASGAAAGRYYYQGKAFRVAPPGSERPEEFLQIGIEAYEVAGTDAATRVESDAEIAALAWRSSAAGGRQDLSMLFGDVGLFAAFVDSLDLAAPLAARLKRAFARPRLMKAELAGDAPEGADRPSRLADLLSNLPEAEAVGVLQELWTLAGVEPVGGRGPAEIVHRLTERAEGARAGRLDAAQADAVRAFLAISDRPQATLTAIEALAGDKGAALSAAVAAWRPRLARMTELGVPAEALTLATAFGREFGYYDGVLFEVRSAALGDEQPLAAGGRYDGLLARLGDETEAGGAVGCMVRPARAFAVGGAG